MEPTSAASHLVLQLAVILVAAKIGAEIFERLLKQPGVLGELVTGMAVGPFALGGLSLAGVGPLFSPSAGEHASFIPVSTELWAVAQIGAVILLFFAGLETDVRLFFRYGAPAFVVAAAGVVVPFLLGDLATVAFGLARSPLDTVALFMGAIMTATSVGITARVLRDIRRLDSPEGITILAAAVIDDVLGIVVLTLVVSIEKSGAVSLLDLGLIGAKAIGFWVLLLGIGIGLAGSIASALLSLRSPGARAAVALGLGFGAAALAESFGLALIVGAYSIGLALSNTSVAEELREHLAGAYNVFVPIFFAVMGMLVSFQAMAPVIVFGLVISLLAILGKVLGCGLPSLGVGFNRWGAARIGVGMLPRGEVALIIAGVGISSGAIGADIFGVAIMMTMVTTLLAPIILVPSFARGTAGWRDLARQEAVVARG